MKLYESMMALGILGSIMLALLFGRYVSEDGQYSYQYFIDGQIERSPCQESDFFHQLDDMNLMPKELECARIEVPLDYSQQASELISLALTRLPASSSTKIGSLIVLSGGPGEHSLDLPYTHLTGSDFADIRASFDIIGLAPRGILPSFPDIYCGDRDEKDPEEIVDACREYLGDEMLTHVSTIDVVHDIEQIRMLLGEEQISLLGYSYGTKIVLYYAMTYGESLRVGILDGIVDITQDMFAMLAGQSLGYQKAFDAFLQYCISAKGGCPLGEGSVEYDDMLSSFHALLQRLDESPLVLSETLSVSASEVLSFIDHAFLRSDGFESVRHFLAVLQSGDREAVAQVLGFSLQGESDGEDEGGEQGEEKLFFDDELALDVINCADFAPLRAYRDFRKRYVDHMRAIDRLSPYDNYTESEDDEYLSLCYYWPVQGKDRGGYENMIDGTSRLLFVAHTGDPTTPYENASAMSQLFKSPLITREGYMHTIVFSAESPCIDALVAQYLLQPEDALPSQICP